MASVSNIISFAAHPIPFRWAQFKSQIYIVTISSYSLASQWIKTVCGKKPTVTASIGLSLYSSASAISGSSWCSDSLLYARAERKTLISAPLYVSSPAIGDRGEIGLSSLDPVLSMAEPRRFSIGYALAPKKRQSFIQPSLVNLARERGIDLVPIDTDRPLSLQGPFDCVIHKIYGEDWRAQLKDYAEKNPFVTVIDQPDAIERLHNRISMLQVVSELEIAQEKETFGIPSQIVVYDSMSLSDSRAVGALRFPVIAKPLVADGSAKSHKMSLVFHRDGLLKLKPPLVLQEFVNHGGVIFKVYVVGDYVKCVKRKSLPDVSLEKLDTTEGSLSFCQVSNTTTQEEYYESMQLEAEMPPLSFLTDIAKGLRRAMRLNLFNFDVIRDSNSGNHYFVIDINYFPGYAKMPSYETILVDFFCKIVHAKSKEEDVDSAITGDDNEAKLLSSNHFGSTENIESKC